MFGYGWIRDIPDQRDLKYSFHGFRTLPKIIDLRPNCPPVQNQGQLASCTANAIGSAYWFIENKQKIETFYPSRLFIYYNERVREGTVRVDCGAMIRTGIKTVRKEGVCPEEEWPYFIENFAERPAKACYKHAKKHQVLRYSRIPQALKHLKGCLVNGYPFVFGFSVYESFESDKVSDTGIVTLPTAEERLICGHAVMAVGYDDTVNSLIVLNSWGKEWGIDGYFLLPYEYVLNKNLAADFWVIELIEN